jgi:hypothetical protein
MNEFYAQQSIVTDPGDYRVKFEGLPTDIGQLCKVVQGLVTHRNASKLYGVELTETRKSEGETRYVSLMLKKILERDNAPLIVARTPDKKFAGVCRDFAVLLCSILRHQGQPARLRCGFAAYFGNESIKYEDHWVCEYWDNASSQWLIADAELDDVYQKRYSFDFPNFNVPRAKFILAGDAWQLCKAGRAEANDFGVGSIKDVRGLWFIRNDLLRDLAALNKVEVLPWDEWGLSDKELDDTSQEELRLLERAAVLTTDNSKFDEMKSFYKDQPELRVPKSVKSYTTYNGIQMIKLRD